MSTAVQDRLFVPLTSAAFGWWLSGRKRWEVRRDAPRLRAGDGGKEYPMSNESIPEDTFGLLLRKYVVLKVQEHDEEVQYESKRSPTFVLDPIKDNDYGQASRAALVTYALEIHDRNPGLARDLRQWVQDIENGLRRKK